MGQLNKENALYLWCLDEKRGYLQIERSTGEVEQILSVQQLEKGGITINQSKTDRKSAEQIEMRTTYVSLEDFINEDFTFASIKRSSKLGEKKWDIQKRDSFYIVKQRLLKIHDLVRGNEYCSKDFDGEENRNYSLEELEELLRNQIQAKGKQKETYMIEIKRGTDCQVIREELGPIIKDEQLRLAKLYDFTVQADQTVSQKILEQNKDFHEQPLILSAEQVAQIKETYGLMKKLEKMNNLSTKEKIQTRLIQGEMLKVFKGFSIETLQNVQELWNKQVDIAQRVQEGWIEEQENTKNEIAISIDTFFGEKRLLENRQEKKERVIGE